MEIHPPCPDCGSSDVAEVHYGQRGPDARALQDTGLVFYSCIVREDDNPAWLCHGCGQEWGDAPAERFTGTRPVDVVDVRPSDDSLATSLRDLFGDSPTTLEAAVDVPGIGDRHAWPIAFFGFRE